MGFPGVNYMCSLINDNVEEMTVGERKKSTIPITDPREPTMGNQVGVSLTDPPL